MSYDEEKRWALEVLEKLGGIDRRLSEVESKLPTPPQAAFEKDLYEVARAINTVLKVLHRLGNFLKWLAPIGIVWIIFRTGAEDFWHWLQSYFQGFK